MAASRSGSGYSGSLFYLKNNIKILRDVLQTPVVALGGGLCVWGGINLLEGYGQDTPGSNAHVR